MRPTKQGLCRFVNANTVHWRDSKAAENASKLRNPHLSWVNPGYLQEQSFSMTVPGNPTEATTKEETSLGPIGMAINGVAIYNDREGGNVPVNAEKLTTFDTSGGHSGPGGLCHYHRKRHLRGILDIRALQAEP
jgi:hypothetical protein